MKKNLQNLVRIFYDYKKSSLTYVSREQYKKDFLNDEKIRVAAFEKATASRNFEIEMYWKRANYFWTFLIPTFAGYFALVNSNNYLKKDYYNHIEVYLIICIGFLISVAWALVNKGSKSWQRHWETHVDLLENSITGPLYKTVYPTKTFSVSKINEIISWFFSSIWFILGIKYFISNEFILFCLNSCDIDFLVIITTIFTILALMSMTLGYGRGYFSHREITMHRRSVKYLEGNE